jgi:bifunctional enzyme CysN/CysC
MVQGIMHRLNISTLAVEREPGSLALNEIGRAKLRLAAPIVCDPYTRCRETGSFILIDEGTNNTVGAGLIAASPAETR